MSERRQLQNGGVYHGWARAQSTGLRTYSDGKAGDSFFFTLGDGVLSERHVMGLPVGDHHHHLGGPRTGPAVRIEAPLTEGEKRTLVPGFRVQAIALASPQLYTLALIDECDKNDIIV